MIEKTPNNSPVHKPSKAEIVSEYIKDGLLAGVWKPKERINDLDIAERLGVSRSSVREALVKLAETKILEKIQWKGYYVKSLTDSEVEAIVELRKSVEDIAIRRICGNGNHVLYGQIRKTIDRSEQALVKNEKLLYMKYDFEFHEKLYEGSGNPYLKNTIANLIFSINILRNISMGSVQGFQATAEASINDHRKILNAIEKGDLDGALTLMDDHLNAHLVSIRKNLNSDKSVISQPEIAFDTKNVLGESPHWNDEEEVLYWLDIQQGLLLGANKGKKNPEILYKGDRIGGITLQSTYDLLLFFNNGTIGSFSIKNRLITLLNIHAPDDVDSTYFNDAIADSMGRVYVGSIASRTAPGAVYRIDTDGTMEKVISDIPISNGMGFSPDNRFFYHSDSYRHVINRYDYNTDSGTISNKSQFYKTDSTIEPDGLTVDSEGNVISALWNGGAVIFIDPNGTLIKTVEMPTINVTSICFARQDLKTLYITSAGGDNRIRNGETAGSVFRLSLTKEGKKENRSRILI